VTVALFDVFRRTVELAEASEPVVPMSEAVALANENELLQESLLGLEELAMEDINWRRMISAAPYEFSRRGLLLISAMCRVMSIKNPLIKRGLGLRANYVWGQGVTLVARAGADAPQDVNAVVSAFWDDPATQRVLSGAQAQAERERDLGTDGQWFISAITDRITGSVQLRLIPQTQILDWISNPDDLLEVWYVRREWSVNAVNLTTGALEQRLQSAWYPILGYQPPAAARPQQIAGWPVRWDEPILHAAVNRPSESIWGIPDAYAAVDWARAYSDFLTDWAKLMRALSRYAWKAKTPGGKAAQLRQALNRPTTDPITGRPGLTSQAGQAAVMDPSTELEAVSKTGASFDADSGRPIAMMVSAALDVPVTMLLLDPGITGTRATAETLDQPFERSMGNRRKLWESWIDALVGHVIDASVKAPRGALRGMVEQVGDRQIVTLAGDVERTVTVDWPEMDAEDPLTRVQAIAAADASGHLPPRLVVQMFLQALGVDDIDEILDEMTDENGDFLDPALQQAAQAVAREKNGQPGSQAAEAYR
jgi:hypothetical protein